MNWMCADDEDSEWFAEPNRSQLVALAGFDPIQIQSGTSIHGKSRISKRGNREVRKRLYEATLSAARYNPSRSRSCRATPKLPANGPEEAQVRASSKELAKGEFQE